ncbi:Uncharacterized protein HZ326_21012 [Fusarium oxysporum f. sp. albedinis]|nr:Uncharacterized protein HZ326_21012 [Fusarium oxysporum f. sp. albedinis]
MNRLSSIPSCSRVAIIDMDPQQGFNIHALVKEFLFRIRVVTRFAHSLAWLLRVVATFAPSFPYFCSTIQSSH